MASDPVRQIQDALRKIDRVVDDSLSPKNMKQLADKAANEIKERTRDGYGVNNHDSGELTLKPLTMRTIEIRNDLASKDKLHNDTSPSKSNVTRSGKMTDSIKGSSPRKGTGRISINGSRNKRVAGELEQGGRTFFNLSRTEVKSIAKAYSLLFARELSKLLTKK